MRIYLFVNWLFTMPFQVRSMCDVSTNTMVVEGNIGRSELFSWLGVLRVYINDYEDKRVAVTGIILIKKRYALVNADDVAKIPQKMFNEDTQVMFMVAAEVPWYCRPQSYILHPEYGTNTYSTIAVLELNLENTQGYPMRPICWSRESTYKKLTHLYVAGYTDENHLLEKIIYKVQYMKQEVCAEFYKRAGLADKNRIPAHYICAFSPSNILQCIWENGMVLVTNASKHFSLIGFNVRGLGCAAPGRFIDLQHYRDWIQGVTIDNEKPVYDETRRAKDPENIPVHEMFRVNNMRRKNIPKSLPMQYELYPFDTEKQKHFNVQPKSNHSLAIIPFNDKMEFYEKSCKDLKTLIYREDMELKSQRGAQGYGYYKISLYDLTKYLCTCAYLTIDSEWRSEATFSYNEFMEVGEGQALTSSEETPEHLIKHIITEDRTVPSTDNKPRPNKHMKPTFVRLVGNNIKVMNYDLYVKFRFKNSALLKVEMYAVANIPKFRRHQMSAELPIENEYLLKNDRWIGEKIWYNEFLDTSKLKSGFVDEVPDVVAKAFSYSDNVPTTVSSNENKSIPSLVMDVYRPTASPIPVKDYVHLLRFSTRPPLLYRPTHAIRDIFHEAPLAFLSDRVSDKSSHEFFDVLSSSRSYSFYISNISFTKILCFKIYLLLLNL